MIKRGESKAEVLQLLLEGGDERLDLKDQGAGGNRYNINPLHPNGLLYRGSCTCGVINPETKALMGAGSTVNWLEGSEDEWAEAQRERLKSLIEPAGPFDVFFAPSGTDLLYFPLLFAKARSERPILSILSCPEELGGGSRLAVAGKGFSHKTAMGATQEKGAMLHPTLVGEVVELPARTASGHIRRRKEDIEHLIHSHPDKTIIVHLVFGSKSGIKDDLDVIVHHPNVLWTVDLCQFRADPDLIGDLLGKGAMVLITGSKFYQAPPFCGALLVPEVWIQELAGSDLSAVASLSNILVRSDIPVHFDAMRRHLVHLENPGSRLRWECALLEMEACHALPREDIDATIQAWNTIVCRAIGSHEELELIPDQAKTNDSIVSFRVRQGDGYCGEHAIKALFDALTLGQRKEQVGFDRLFIGQPVCYGDRWFIRVALGSYETRRATLAQQTSWTDDERLIALIAQEARSLFR